ncbi:hypothetical protein [Vibrio sp. Hal054]|uniref:hypothetical protein n=1 Tax=Vibrio sp. Hal054 TaxID=3035158 RepID=UPI00301E209E
MLYSQTLFCNASLQEQPRPTQWYQTKRISNLTKFSWLNPSPIHFESSYHSAHDPLNLDYDTDAGKRIMENNRSVLPLGVMSFLSENKAYWRNCAINYLIDYNYHLYVRTEYQTLINNWRGEADQVPKHWLSEVKSSNLDMLEAKAKFKTCRAYEKSHVGYIEHHRLPESIQKEVSAVKRLLQYIDHIPHNRALALDCIQSFLTEGFNKQVGFFAITEEAGQALLDSSLATQLNTLVALLQERITEAHFLFDDRRHVTGVKLRVNSDQAMHYFLSFTSRVYGSMSHLDGFKLLREKYGDIQDVSTWFHQDNLYFN